jgi:hypothetical protein
MNYQGLNNFMQQNVLAGDNNLRFTNVFYRGK